MRPLLLLLLALTSLGMANPWVAGWIATRGWVDPRGNFRIEYGARIQWDGPGYFIAGDIPTAAVLAGMWSRVGPLPAPLRLYLGAGYDLETHAPVGEFSLRTPFGLIASVFVTENSTGARLGLAVDLHPGSLN